MSINVTNEVQTYDEPAKCQMIGWGLKFCAHCDFAISRIEMDSYRGDLDKMMCPRCGMCRLSMFYSYGSQGHINRREAWERREVTGAPLPVPNAEAHSRADQGETP